MATLAAQSTHAPTHATPVSRARPALWRRRLARWLALAYLKALIAYLSVATLLLLASWVAGGWGWPSVVVAGLALAALGIVSATEG